MRGLRWGIVAGALVVTTPAWADDASGRDAQARFEEGIARARANRWADALVSFQQAYAVTHRPTVVWNLAVSEEKVGHPVDALTHFKEFLALAPKDDPNVARAPKHIEALDAAVGHVEVAAPAGATVLVDAVPAPSMAPLGAPIDVMPGHHVVEARIGGAQRSQGIDVVAGQTMRSDFSDLVAAPAAGATAPQSSADAAPGATAAPLPATATEQPAPSGPMPLAKIVTVASVGGLAVVSMVMGAGFGVASNQEANRVAGLHQQVGDSGCFGPAAGSAPCQQLTSNRQAAETNHGLSTGFWVAGGVLAAGAVGLWFLWPHASSGTAAGAAAGTATVVRVLPGAGPATAGATVVGTF